MKTLILGLLALLAVSVLTATAAFAQTVWTCNGHFLSAKCLVDAENERKPLRLEDMGASSAVQCEVGSVLGEGWVGPRAEDETTAVEFMNPTTACVPSAKALNLKEEEVTNACKKVQAVEAVGLPWDTELVLEAGIAWDLIKKKTAVLPGYLVKCEIVGGTSQDDLCDIAEPTTPLVKLEPVGGTIRVIFEEKLQEAAEALDCTVSGPENGLVVGFFLLEALEGGTQVSLELAEE